MYADRMDLRQLEIIRAIADSGSFTAAGEKLHVSQSAISRQILLLEDELGEPVFHRIGRRIRITPAGESLLQLSHRVFQDLHDTVATISDTQVNGVSPSSKLETDYSGFIARLGLLFAR